MYSFLASSLPCSNFFSPLAYAFEASSLTSSFVSFACSLVSFAAFLAESTCLCVSASTFFASSSACRVDSSLAGASSSLSSFGAGGAGGDSRACCSSWNSSCVTTGESKGKGVLAVSVRCSLYLSATAVLLSPLTVNLLVRAGRVGQVVGVMVVAL